MIRRHLIALVLAALSATAAQAQDFWAQNAQFDRQMAAMLNQAQQQNAQSQMQIWQTHLRVNGARLQREYAQLVRSGQAVGSYEQYAYFDLMTARGTDVQGALQHQRDQFRGQQDAFRTVQQGNDSYNAGWYERSQRQSAAVENHDRQAIRGVAPYVDPTTGRTTMLPHQLPTGQAIQVDGSIYAQDASGQYYRREPNGWVRMAAGR